MLYSGVGCLKNYREAAWYYRMAAEANAPAAANAMGLMHELGRGMGQNLAMAAAWYRRAADLGSAEGAFNCALLLERGDPRASSNSPSPPPFFPRAPPSGAPPPLPELQVNTASTIPEKTPPAPVGSGGGGGGGGNGFSVASGGTIGTCKALLPPLAIGGTLPQPPRCSRGHWGWGTWRQGPSTEDYG
ncbi:unnamed protein product [Discosporangium mesarthrocarpum]